LIGAAAPNSRAPEESKIEGYKNQHNTNVHYQPFPKTIPKEEQIYAHDDRYHDEKEDDGYALRHLVKI
jgi:hypothetical protein